MSQMRATNCPECGEPVSLLARECSHCGAPNPARRTVTVVAAALGAVLIAGAVAIAIVMTGESPTSKDGRPVAAGGGGDFAWLTKAMSDCDAEAAKEPGILHFMVTPLVDDPKDDPGWRRIALNDIGNAILLSAENTIAGLKRGALKMTKDEYVLAVRDDATSVVFRWSPSSGVKRFATKDSGGPAAFKVQFQKRDGGGGNNWGASFERQPGTCYWVNAIIRL